MKKKDYSTEFKGQVLKECQEVGNVAVVARRHGLAPSTIHTWLGKQRSVGSTEPLPRDVNKRIKELEGRLKSISVDNDLLKRIVAEKELQIAILEEMRDTVNPQ